MAETTESSTGGRIGKSTTPLLFQSFAEKCGLEVLPSSRDFKPPKKKPSKKKEMHEEALQAFTKYIDLGPTRTLPKVAEIMGRSLSTVEYWSWQYGWKAEIDAIRARRKEQDLEGDWGEINRGRVNGIRSVYRMFRWMEALTDVIDRAVSDKRSHTPAEIVQMARYRRAMRLMGISISSPKDLKETMLTLKGLVDFETEPGEKGKKVKGGMNIIHTGGNLIIKG